MKNCRTFQKSFHLQARKMVPDKNLNLWISFSYETRFWLQDLFSKVAPINGLTFFVLIYI